jgi:phage gp36-like protein
VAYCAKSDLVERFGESELKELTDETLATRVSDAEVASACDEASSEIDTYLGQRYTLPLSVIPAIVKKWASDMARFFLWGDRAGEGHPVRLACEDAREALKNISTGKAQLPGQDPDTSVASSAVAIVERTAAMTDETLALRPL